jgi:hypothetical protein
MGQDDGIQSPRVEGRRGPVLQAQLLVPLEQAAIDQNAMPTMAEQIPRAGHRAGGTQKLERRSILLGFLHGLSTVLVPVSLVASQPRHLEYFPRRPRETSIVRC